MTRQDGFGRFAGILAAMLAIAVVAAPATSARPVLDRPCPIPATAHRMCRSSHEPPRQASTGVRPRSAPEAPSP